MELRSKNKSTEFKTLHEKLDGKNLRRVPFIYKGTSCPILNIAGLGLYEKGMDLDQMRQVMGVVDESIIETSFNDQDIEFAIRESERDFASANVCNSTMIGSLSENTNVLENSSFGHFDRSFKAFSSPFSSPEVVCVQKIIVNAEVHHELDWSPTKISPEMEAKRKSRKRAADAMSQDDSGVIMSINSFYETSSV